MANEAGYHDRVAASNDAARSIRRQRQPAGPALEVK
jgi:hypothetical protein